MTFDTREFNAPATRERMAGLFGRLGLGPESRVLDVGCGRGTMLSMLAASTGCHGVGVDPKVDEIALARVRGGPGAERLVFHAVTIQEFEDELAGPEARAFDAILCIGASHAFGGPGEALGATLDALGPRLCPGGRLLLGEGHWQRVPPDAYLVATGITRHELTSPEANIAVAEGRGFTLEHHEAATPEEWDVFEGGSLDAARAAAAAAPEDPALAARLAHWLRWQDAYRRWGRDTMGFAYYVLRSGAPASKPLRKPARFSH